MSLVTFVAAATVLSMTSQTAAEMVRRTSIAKTVAVVALEGLLREGTIA